MVIKYDVEITNDAIIKNIDKLTNQIFKLLPYREENADWQPLLRNLIIEVAGMSSLLFDHTDLFLLLCKMEGLLTLTAEDDFPQFRTTVFECLGLCNNLKKVVI